MTLALHVGHRRSAGAVLFRVLGSARASASVPTFGPDADTIGRATWAAVLRKSPLRVKAVETPRLATGKVGAG